MISRGWVLASTISRFPSKTSVVSGANSEALDSLVGIRTE